MAADFLLDPGTNGYITSLFNLVTTELNTLGIASATTSSVGGSSGVFSQSRNSVGNSGAGSTVGAPKRAACAHSSSGPGDASSATRRAGWSRRMTASRSSPRAPARHGPGRPAVPGTPPLAAQRQRQLGRTSLEAPLRIGGGFRRRQCFGGRVRTAPIPSESATGAKWGGE